jgi:hypothetical protein
MHPLLCVEAERSASTSATEEFMGMLQSTLAVVFAVGGFTGFLFDNPLLAAADQIARHLSMEGAAMTVGGILIVQQLFREADAV